MALLRELHAGRHDGRRHHPRPGDRRQRCRGRSRCATGGSSATSSRERRCRRRDLRAGPARPPATSSGSAAPGCGPGRCGCSCPRWASRSASPRWSRWSASRRPAGPSSTASSTALGTNLLTVAPGQTLFGERRAAADGVGGDDRPDRAGHRRRSATGHGRTPRSTAPTGSRRARPAASACYAAPHRPARHRRRHGAQRHLAERGDRPVPGGGARRRRPRSGSASAGRPGRAGAGSAASGSPWSASSTRCRWRRELDTRRAGRLAARRRLLGFDGHPTTVYTRSRDDAVEAVRRCSPRPPTRSTPNEVTGLPAVRRAGREGGHRRDVHRAAARARRGGAARRRRRGGQHDGDLGAGAARRDRPAPVARRDPGPDPDAVPGRVAAAVRARRGGGWLLGAAVTGATRSRRAGPPLCRRGRWPAAWWRRW